MARTGAVNWAYIWGFSSGWWMAAVLAGILGIGFLTRGRVVAALDRLGGILSDAPGWKVALGVAVAGAGLTLWVVFDVFDQRTILNDASVQLLQARYFAAGMLAGPPLALPEFWSVQFMVLTAAGWVSQYPPGHALLLAGGFGLGAPWLTMVGASALLGAMLVLSFDRLMPERRAIGRTAALLAVSSPFFLGLAGAYMSHATLAASAAAALYLALRAQDGGPGWTIAAGAAVGLMVTIRPVTGLVLGVLLTAAIWLTAPGLDLRDTAARSALLRRFSAWGAGGLPFAIGFAAFNARFFGGPFTLGYVAASGPNHGLGFHEDPWGRIYTPTAAIGHSSSELISLSREMLGAPVPIVAVIALFLLLAPRLERGPRFIAAWALLPLLVSALYWHHDLVFGPRMLGEALPGWTALAVLAVTWLVRVALGTAAKRAPGDAAAGPAMPRRWAADAIALAAVAAVAFGAAVGGPARLGVRGAALGAHPDVPEERPSLVFVHETWGDRLGGRLAGAGLRLDSVRTLLTRYHPCQLEASLLGVSPDQAVPVCQREQQSDAVVSRFGIPGLTGLLWLDDLPGLPPEGVLWVRDLGPERNRRVLEAHPDRVPLFLLPTARGEFDVVPYQQGVTTMWPPLPSGG